MEKSPPRKSKTTIKTATITTTTATRPSSDDKPKDGAKTLLDAVTAYQRRTARAERTAARHQPIQPTSNLSRVASQSNPVDLPNSSYLDSSGHITQSQLDIHSRKSPTVDSDRKTSPSHPSTTHPRQQRNSTQSRPSVSPFLAKENHPDDRNSSRPFTRESHHSPKLFDPRSDSVRLSKRDLRNPATSSPSRSSKPNPNQSYLTVKRNPTLIEDQESSQSNPSQTSLPVSKSQPPHLRSTPIQQDRDWKTKKATVRTSLNESRQLFDPRKHDPVKFSTTKRATRETKPNPSSTNINKPTDSLHHNNSKRDDITPIEDDENNRNDLVINLKQAYKRILGLETALKDEESAAKAKEEELRAREVREGLSFHSANIKNSTASVLRNHTQQKRFQQDYWVRLSKQHRELAEAHQYFLEMALDPRLPPSMHTLPHKYNTPSRLWQIGFHQLLERLRHALPFTTTPSTKSMDNTKSGQRLLEHMTDFIYFAYGFYTALLEEQRLLPFRNVWIEQLGDLARYRMAVAGLMTKLGEYDIGNPDPKKPIVAHQNSSDQVDTDSEQERIRPKPRGNRRTRQSIHGEDEDQEALTDPPQSTPLDLSSDEAPSPVPLRTLQLVSPPPKGSIGIAALNDWDFEEQEIWRATAQDWYAKGLADNPATGRLHHHLALLSKGDELKTLYHYCKSLTVAHPYLPARESILPFFEQEHQARRSRPEVSINDLFVHLHGMLFTKIQLDDFDSELARFIEKLMEDRLLSDKQGPPTGEFNRQVGHNPQSTISNASWTMMAAVNICAMSQYGVDDGAIRVAQSNSNRSQGFTRNSNKLASKGVNARNKPATIAPQAILLSHPSNTIPVENRKISCSSSSDDGASCTGHDDNPSLASNTQDHRHATNISVDNAIDEDLNAILIKRPEVNEIDEVNEPIVFILAAKLTFEMLKEVLQQDILKDVCPYLTLVLTFLGSLSNNRRVMKKLEKYVPWDKLVSYFNRIPKSVQATSPFCSSIQDSIPRTPSSASTQLRISGVPLLEDWCLRGMDWAFKGLFVRGYWKQQTFRGTSSPSESERQTHDLLCDLHIDSELDALAALNGGFEIDSYQLNSGASHIQQPSRQLHPSRIDMEHKEVIQENIMEFETRDDPSILNNTVRYLCSASRWKRIGLVAFWISTTVSGIEHETSSPVKSSGRPMFMISHYLKQKILRWQAEFKQEEEERQLLKSRLIGSRHISAVECEEEMEFGGDEDGEEDEEEEEEDPNDSELVKSLKARRRDLIMLLNQTKNASTQPASILPTKVQVGYKKKQSTEGHQSVHEQRKKSNNSSAKLNVLAGYTTLVFDTNILIGMLSIVKDLLESEQFTIIIPLVVITELDGLKKKINDSDLNSRKLGQEALEAIQYLEKSIKVFSKVLKIQTSRGNYLRDLSIRNERINFQIFEGDPDNNEFLTTNAARNLDDVVLRATTWQLDHFSNRLASSSSIQPEEDQKQPPEKVILLTLDRNLRLKARARGILAADEKQIIHLMGSINPHKQSQANRHQTHQKLGGRDP